jgi:Plasmid pRiA4b ORF-3-like protein
MEAERKVGAVQLSARLRGVSPPVTRRLVITEQSSLAELHAILQVSFGWSAQHLYRFQIRGWQFGDPALAIELGLAGGGVDIPLAAFEFDIGEPFLTALLCDHSMLSTGVAPFCMILLSRPITLDVGRIIWPITDLSPEQIG